MRRKRVHRARPAWPDKDVRGRCRGNRRLPRGAGPGTGNWTAARGRWCRRRARRYPCPRSFAALPGAAAVSPVRPAIRAFPT
ncbi:hypothetical protein Tharo_0033 [Thauera aromatica K172]|uniref:Uncharacterized protein n=1 Tax=Thauera aromatica K172 TaxID=44139 RepID=A0A2R4BI36_THAAR|nr:hypothetical protein Tharo_0033 [Thauera aromatica K172]